MEKTHRKVGRKSNRYIHFENANKDFILGAQILIKEAIIKYSRSANKYIVMVPS